MLHLFEVGLAAQTSTLTSGGAHFPGELCALYPAAEANLSPGLSPAIVERQSAILVHLILGN